MIQPNELRLGNWVTVSGFPMYVEAIFSDTVYLEFEGNEGDVCEENIKDIEPIPLTEERLLKFGFKKDGLDGYKLSTFDCFEITLINGKFYLTINGNEDRIIEVESVHELQNLYFALTGKELEIKL